MVESWQHDGLPVHLGDGAMIDRTQSTGSSDFLCLSANGSYGNSFSRLQSSSSYIGAQGAMDYTQQQTTHPGAIDYTQQHTTHQGAIDYTQQQHTTHEYGERQQYTSQDQQHFQMPPQQSTHGYIQQQQQQNEQVVPWPGEAPAINGMEVYGPMDPDVNAPGWNEELWFEQEAERLRQKNAETMIALAQASNISLNSFKQSPSRS